MKRKSGESDALDKRPIARFVESVLSRRFMSNEMMVPPTAMSEETFIAVRVGVLNRLNNNSHYYPVSALKRALLRSDGNNAIRRTIKPPPKDKRDKLIREFVTGWTEWILGDHGDKQMKDNTEEKKDEMDLDAAIPGLAEDAVVEGGVDAAVQDDGCEGGACKI